ncbi:MAG: 23S rRNA (pseudouridine(1915)-N(3))-methyltransferase RlmH [Xanthobacteraceae bacterium]
MRLTIIAIGRLKDGPERELAARYQARFTEIGRRLGFRSLDIHDIAESRARDAASRIAEEGAAIAARCPDQALLVALDEHGRALPSTGFAALIGGWRDAGVAEAVFIIGGADGLSPELRRKAKLTLAFGAATWPHQMVRVMLLEQIYRAATILSGHPYHRA